MRICRPASRAGRKPPCVWVKHSLCYRTTAAGSAIRARLKGDKRFGPQGFFTWRVGNTEFGAAELLYLLGRIRRNLKTDAFVEAETKAYDWVMKHGVRERFWPINVCHSMSGGYPIWQHSVTALYFSRYLLECAPPDRRDLKLAEEVARWAEDTGIDWNRAAEGPQSGQTHTACQPHRTLQQ